MKLVKNWKKIAISSWSMWLLYAGIALMTISEALVWWFQTPVLDPYLVGYVGYGLMYAGIIARLLDQGIGDA